MCLKIKINPDLCPVPDKIVIIAVICAICVRDAGTLCGVLVCADLVLVIDRWKISGRRPIT